MFEITESQRYSVYTKARCLGNPGRGAFGIIVLYDCGKKVAEYSEVVESGTNNTMEYCALICALKLLVEKGSGSEVFCFVNSQLVVRQLGGEYRVGDGRLVELVGSLRQAEEPFVGVKYEEASKVDRWIVRAKSLARMACSDGG